MVNISFEFNLDQKTKGGLFNLGLMLHINMYKCKIIMVGMHLRFVKKKYIFCIYYISNFPQ